MVLSGFSAKSQVNGNRDHKAGVEVNNYNNSGDYDFYYSSRINRFHRSYSTFTYYSPVFTDSYWYSYQPYTWGISIYGGQAGFGYDAGYPVYNSYSWSSPYYGNSYYWGYTPNYIGWYSPLVITVNSWNWWPHSTYSWHGNSHYYDYSYNNHNYYNNQGYTNSYRRGGPKVLQ